MVNCVVEMHFCEAKTQPGGIKRNAKRAAGGTAGRMRGMLLTVDGLLALIFALIGLSAFAVLSQSHTPEDALYNDFASLGHDYLVLKHVKEKAITPGDFRSLTGLNASEFPVSGSLVVRASAMAYPRICGCAASPCNLAASGAACMANQEALNKSKKELWVTPG